LFDALTPFSFDQALRATKPSARATGLAECEQPKAQPEGSPCRCEAFTGLQVSVINALLRREHFIVARGQPGRPRQPRKIFWSERRRLVSQRKRFKSIVPRVSLERHAPAR